MDSAPHTTEQTKNLVPEKTVQAQAHAEGMGQAAKDKANQAGQATSDAAQTTKDKAAEAKDKAWHFVRQVPFSKSRSSFCQSCVVTQVLRPWTDKHRLADCRLVTR